MQVDVTHTVTLVTLGKDEARAFTARGREQWFPTIQKKLPICFTTPHYEATLDRYCHFCPILLDIIQRRSSSSLSLDSSNMKKFSPSKGADLTTLLR